MVKTKITYAEYLTLLGLKQLAVDKVRELDTITKKAGEIIGEDEPLVGHAGDVMYGDSTVDDFLNKMDIEVEQ